MLNAEWGTKRTCQNCTARFYDMRRTPIICPKCGTTFNPEALLRGRRSKASAVEAEALKAKKSHLVDKGVDFEELDPDDLEAVADEEGEDVGIEDTSELGEDDDDMVDVIDNIDQDEDN
jgi:uncharacterized protein (TIGR02300 family)